MKLVLVIPNRPPNKNSHCRFSDSVSLIDPIVLLVEPFDFEAKACNTPALQMISYEQWDKLSTACHTVGIVPPKLANASVVS